MADATHRESRSAPTAAVGVPMSPAVPSETSAAPASSDLPSFRFPLSAQPARVTAGGGGRGQSVSNFPAGKNIAAVSMWLHPGGLRELHWHPNAAEWGYVLTHRCRVTSFN